MSRGGRLALVLSLLLVAPAPRVVSCVGRVSTEAAKRCCAKCHHDALGGTGGCCMSRVASPGVFSGAFKAPPLTWTVSLAPILHFMEPALTRPDRAGPARAHGPPGPSLYQQGCLLRI